MAEAEANFWGLKIFFGDKSFESDYFSIFDPNRRWRPFLRLIFERDHFLFWLNKSLLNRIQKIWRLWSLWSLLATRTFQSWSEYKLFYVKLTKYFSATGEIEI